jgi:uncharacterized protein
MKKTIAILLTIICSTIFAFGQDNNVKLYQAITKNDTSLVKEMLNDKADPNFVVTQGSWMKVNMLITAVNNGNIDIVRLLIVNKADVNWKDGFKTTALMYAASKGNKEILVLLLNNGADINDNDGQDNTVLSAAKESKNQEMIKYVEMKLKEKS